MDNNNFLAFGIAEPLTLIRPNPRSKALGLSGSTGKDFKSYVRSNVAENPNLQIEFIQNNFPLYDKKWFKENPNEELKQKVYELFDIYGDLV